MNFLMRPHAFSFSIFALGLLSAGSSTVAAQGDVVSPNARPWQMPADRATAKPRVIADCPADQRF